MIHGTDSRGFYRVIAYDPAEFEPWRVVARRRSLARAVAYLLKLVARDGDRDFVETTYEIVLPEGKEITLTDALRMLT